jgi:hypothetical protein
MGTLASSKKAFLVLAPLIDPPIEDQDETLNRYDAASPRLNWSSAQPPRSALPQRRSYLGQRDQELVKQRTQTMNTSRELTNENRTIHVHIVDVVAQKEGGYTVVVQPHTGSEITSSEVWRATLGGDYRGATKVDRLWHLYYGEKPPYSPGTWIDIVLPEQTGEAERSLASE